MYYCLKIYKTTVYNNNRKKDRREELEILFYKIFTLLVKT